MWLAIFPPAGMFGGTSSVFPNWYGKLFSPHPLYPPQQAPNMTKGLSCKTFSRLSCLGSCGPIPSGAGFPSDYTQCCPFVSCAQAVASQQRMKKASVFTYKYRPVDYNSVPKQKYRCQHTYKCYCDLLSCFFSSLNLTHLFLISFLQRFSSLWLISKEIVWVFSKSSFHGYTEVLLKIVHDVISQTLATKVTRQNGSAFL